MNIKLLLVVVAILIVLFIVGVGAGVGDIGSGSEFPPGWAEGLGTLLVIERPVEVEDAGRRTDESCRQLLETGTVELPQGTQCVLYVDPASAFIRTVVRTLTLRLTTAGQLAIFVVHADSGRWTPNLTLEQDDEEKIRLYEKGARVHISCGRVGGGPCRVQLAR